MESQKHSADAAMSLVDHLTELRTRLVYTAYIVCLGFGASWFFGDMLFDIVRAPIEPYLPTEGLVFTNPIDKFMAYLKLSVAAGIVLTCPAWLYQVWAFVVPALHQKEKKYAKWFVLFGTLLFVGGVLFAYYLVFPAAFKFLLGFGSDKEQAMITITEYFSFVTTISLVFGAAFELPLILVLLGLMGVVDSAMLKVSRRYAIVVMAIFSAIVTPPDAISMMMLLIPLIILYEISVQLVGLIGSRRKV